MRINAYLSKAGVASRRKSEEFVLAGRITINNKVAKLTDQVNDDDEVKLDGRKLSLSQKKYFLVNKPVGYTSSSEDEHARLLVTDLVPDKDVFPVGRLDKDSEGLMILTNDGEFAQKLIHPSFFHEREYEVEVKLPYTLRTQKLENAIKFFKCGIRLEEKRTAPASIKLIKQESGHATFKIILTQGLKRQIRRTFEKAGLRVTRLKRTRIAGFELGDLATGKSRSFVIDEG